MSSHAVYQRLANRDLLERCTLGATQNQNESFNNIVWLHCSKTKFVGPETIEFAAHLALLLFNDGKEAAMKSLFSALELELWQRTTVYYKREEQSYISLSKPAGVSPQPTDHLAA